VAGAVIFQGTCISCGNEVRPRATRREKERVGEPKCERGRNNLAREAIRKYLQDGERDEASQDTLRVEVLLKIDIRYPKDTGVIFFNYKLTSPPSRC